MESIEWVPSKSNKKVVNLTKKLGGKACGPDECITYCVHSECIGF